MRREFICYVLFVCIVIVWYSRSIIDTRSWGRKLMNLRLTTLKRVSDDSVVDDGISFVIIENNEVKYDDPSLESILSIDLIHNIPLNEIVFKSFADYNIDHGSSTFAMVKFSNKLNTVLGVSRLQHIK